MDRLHRRDQGESTRRRWIVRSMGSVSPARFPLVPTNSSGQFLIIPQLLYATGGLFSSFDCAVKGYRQKEDPYNAIISGFLTGGTLAVRSGPKGMLGSAIGCGVLLGVFEGVGVLVGRSVPAVSVSSIPRN